MIKFLITKPISVLAVFLAVLVVSVVSIQLIPTSLMPDLDVPEITVKVEYPANSAREIENNATRTLRNQLLQVSQLKNIESESRDESAIIRLQFEYGVDTDIAFLEVNEKIDAILRSLPRDLPRPRVVKASSTDIPILKLTVNLTEDYSDERFLQLSKFVENVIKKRIEQLPDVAIADLNGLVKSEISVQLNEELMNSLNIKHNDVIDAIKANNLELGNLMVKNGAYQYNFIFDKPITTIEEIKNIHLNVNGRLLQLKDLAKIQQIPQEKRSIVLNKSEPAIILSVIKQSNAQVYDLKQSITTLIQSFEKDYPELDFEIHQDQSKLLKLSINNLRSSLIIGSVLAMLIMFFFIQDKTSPWIIALSIPSSLLISVLLLYLFKFSVNIVTLSGLILGVGLMIDNSIIVIDNIFQKRKAGLSWFVACSEGTSEIISPLISSALTTSSVFLPLVFLSGITGALFYAQAVSVTIGLFVSLIISITVIPVIIYLIKKNKDAFTERENKENWYEKMYQKGYNFFFAHAWLVFLIAIVFVGVGYFLFQELPKERLPQLSQNEAIVKVNWNEAITIEESQERITKTFIQLDSVDYIAELGESQQLIENTELLETNEAMLSISVETEDQLQTNLNELQRIIQQNYKNATLKIEPPKDIFRQLFGGGSEEISIKAYNKNNLELPSEEANIALSQKALPEYESENSTRIAGRLIVNKEKLLLYNVDYQQLVAQIKTLFNQNEIDQLKASDGHIPIKLTTSELSNFNQSLNQKFILNTDSTSIPLYHFLSLRNTAQYTTIKADERGEFLSFVQRVGEGSTEKLEKLKIDFSQLFFTETTNGNSFNEVSNELGVVLLVSLLLLYFILASQFESLVLPLIILIEIPIDVGGALLFLYLFGGSINVMSIIGIVVMAGIIINDSILKIHTINRLYKSGVELKTAVKQGSFLRLKPILMTSITTILALAPFLFLTGLGVELQQPLALTVIGGLLIGTFISLYFIPILFYLFVKHTHKK